MNHYRHSSRREVNFADRPKQRIHDGMLTSEALKAVEPHLDIAELICPLCQNDLIHESDLFKCAACHVTGEVVLVVDRRVSADDPQRLSIRFLPTSGGIAPEVWMQAEQNNTFLLSSTLDCPSCLDPITELSEDATGEKPFCCSVLCVPQIKEIDAQTSTRQNQWKVAYDVKVKDAHFPTDNALNLIKAVTYQHQLQQFLPKGDMMPVEKHPPHTSAAPVEHPSPLEAAEKIPFTLDRPTLQAEQRQEGDAGEPQTALGSPNPAEPVADLSDASEADANDNADVSKSEITPLRDTEAISEFIKSHLVRNADAITPRREVYEAYTHWIGKHNQTPASHNSFNQQLRDIYPYVTEGQNRINGELTRCFRGLKLRCDDDRL